MNQMKVFECRRYWAISLRPRFVHLFLSGLKDYEVRTRVPKLLAAGDWLYCVETGTGGHVAMVLEVEKIETRVICLGRSGLIEGSGLSDDEIIAYANGRQYLYALKCHVVAVGNESMNISNLGLTRAPQWFSRIKSHR